jgi:hypothetical protein
MDPSDLCVVLMFDFFFPHGDQFSDSIYPIKCELNNKRYICMPEAAHNLLLQIHYFESFELRPITLPGRSYFNLTFTDLPTVTNNRYLPNLFT